jgi:hypothetical protein
LLSRTGLERLHRLLEAGNLRQLGVCLSDAVLELFDLGTIGIRLFVALLKLWNSIMP